MNHWIRISFYYFCFTQKALEFLLHFPLVENLCTPQSRGISIWYHPHLSPFLQRVAFNVLYSRSRKYVIILLLGHCFILFINSRSGIEALLADFHVLLYASTFSASCLWRPSKAVCISSHYILITWDSVKLNPLLPQWVWAEEQECNLLMKFRPIGSYNMISWNTVLQETSHVLFC